MPFSVHSFDYPAKLTRFAASQVHPPIIDDQSQEINAYLGRLYFMRQINEFNYLCLLVRSAIQRTFKYPDRRRSDWRLCYNGTDGQIIRQFASPNPLAH